MTKKFFLVVVTLISIAVFSCGVLVAFADYNFMTQEFKWFTWYEMIALKYNVIIFSVCVSVLCLSLFSFVAIFTMKAPKTVASKTRDLLTKPVGGVRGNTKSTVSKVKIKKTYKRK